MTRLRDITAEPESARATESVRSFLDRRARVLTHQLSALLGQVASIETEIAEVRRAQEALGPEASVGATVRVEGPITAKATAQAPTVTAGFSGSAEVTRAPTVHMVHALKANDLVTGAPTIGQPTLTVHTATIRQLILRALMDHFHQGAKPNELREFIKNAYGRDFASTSISPQLSRMREEGLVEHIAGTNAHETRWQLASGRRGIVSETADMALRAAMKPKSEP